MRVMFVVESKNLPPSYAERARRAIVNPGNWKRVPLLAMVFATIAAFTSIVPQARSDDEHTAKSSGKVSNHHGQDARTDF